ncbi:MAG: glycosyltransferase [Bacteroidaceae bacterium]|nr:glycosyltransferase [Bacteroidaceae bacterium]
MPVYNAERTVCRMIDSIIAQTYPDWELIAVNDGSADSSGIILDLYANKEPRIKVIHKRNGGVAAARQDGIDMATGTYTIHADSDDWIEPGMIKDMLEVAKNENSDVVISDFYTDCIGESVNKCVQAPLSLDAKDVLYGMYYHGLFGGLWHKMIKKVTYDKAFAEFYPGINFCEDLLLLTRVLFRTNPQIAYLNNAYYHYVVNSDSLTQCVSQQGFASIKYFHKVALDMLSQNEGFATLSDKFIIDEFVVYFMNYLYHDTNELRARYLKIKPLLIKKCGLRWKIGCFCIEIGAIVLAHKLIRF